MALKKSGLGIVAKGLIVLAVPALVQCLFVGWTAMQEERAELLLDEARRAEEISLLINGLIQDIYKEEQALRLYTGEFSPGADDRARIAAARKKLANLKILLKDNRSAADILSAVGSGIASGESIIERATAAFASNNESVQQALRLETRHFAGRVITPELIALGEKQSDMASSFASQRAVLDQSVRNGTYIMVFFNLLLCLGLAVLTTRRITGRLATLALKGKAIGKGALPEPSESDVDADEIARLDRSLCAMAAEVSRSIEREKSIFEGAADIICVLDRQLRILSLSPSVEEMSGYSREKLKGREIWALLERAEHDSLQSVLDEAAAGKFSSENFQGRLRTAGGVELEVLLSILPGRDTIILIAHDISAIRQAERLKQNLLGIVGHELTEPLTKIEGILTELEGDRYGSLNDQGRHTVNRAVLAVGHMSHLLRDLTALDEIECGSVKLHQHSVSPEKLLTRAIALTQAQASDKGISLKLPASENGRGAVYCDTPRIVQVLVNLISNAIKYAPAASTIDLGVRNVSPFVEFSVSDQGPGIPPEMRSSVFERFTQVRDSDAKVGTGLGLAICRALVELHGGRIFVADTARGTTVIFTLPEERRQLGPAVSLETRRQ